MREKTPNDHWSRHPQEDAACADIEDAHKSAWLSPNGRVAVISSFDGREFHLSISTALGKPSDSQASAALAAFGVPEAAEVNCGRRARHYFVRARGVASA